MKVKTWDLSIFPKPLKIKGLSGIIKRLKATELAAETKNEDI
jgi:hypothetical protein